jgi:cellulose synthase/poly-beta-1,6-N-acetylglucosamine synthase-like glycosyltransferase
VIFLYIIAAVLSILIPGMIALAGKSSGLPRLLSGSKDEENSLPIAIGTHSVPAPPGISIVIAAKDEAHNLDGLLQALLNQDFVGKYEIILVLDRCEDDSALISARYAEISPLIHRIEIKETPEGWTGKKWALEKGIAAAQFDRIALTDADCIPESGWLQGISDQLDQGNELVLGVGLYRRTSGILNAFVRFETHLTAMQYTGFARLGMPYMGVGRNMAYTRGFFQRAGGFSAIAHRLSGDDDLLVNHFARADKTATLTASGTRTFSTAPPTFKAWWRQKIRHLSAGTGYRLATQFILSLLPALQAIFYLSLVGVLCSEQPLVLIGGIYAGRTVLAGLFWNSEKGFRMQIDLLMVFPLLDVAYLLYNLVMVPASLLLTPKWKSN